MENISKEVETREATTTTECGLDPLQQEIFSDLGKVETSKSTNPIDGFSKLFALPQLLLNGLNEADGDIPIHEVFQDDGRQSRDPIEQKAVETVLKDLPESERQSLQNARASWHDELRAYDRAYQRALRGTGMLGFPERPSKPDRIRNFEDDVEAARAKILDTIKKM